MSKELDRCQEVLGWSRSGLEEMGRSSLLPSGMELFRVMERQQEALEILLKREQDLDSAIRMGSSVR